VPLYTFAMHKAFTLTLALLTFGGFALAQDEAEYKAWMKSLPPLVGSIRNAADNAAAADAANKLADAFEKVEMFWKSRHADDAVKFAATGHEAAKAIAAGSGDKAANLQKIQGTCGGCHMAHREGTAPDFKIK